MNYRALAILLGISISVVPAFSQFETVHTKQLRASAEEAPLLAAKKSTLPPELEPIQEQFFSEAFLSFVKDLRTAHPELNTGSDALTAPVYNSRLSRQDWIQQFVAAVASQNRLSALDTEKLKSVAEDGFTSYYHDIGYARVPFLEALSTKSSPNKNLNSASVTRIQLPSQYPGHHTLDVKVYVNERFPSLLQDFVKIHHIALFLEDSACSDVVAFQNSQGFSSAVRFMGPRDDPDSQYIFVYNPKSRLYRHAICDIRGADDRSRMSDILGPIFSGLEAFVVRHQSASPFFNFTQQGRDLKLDPQTDRVIIGFQNTIWWQLKITSDAWSRVSITQTGVEVGLFENKKTHERVISIASVYGDEMLQALQIFYDKGARRFVQLGTAGGLDPAAELGDVLLPERFLKPDGTLLTFANDAEKYLLKNPSAQKILHRTAQGWVPNLIAETIDFVTDLKNHGAQALDVESRYFAEFFASHAALEKSVFVTISDRPLGSLNYKRESATRNIPMKSISSLIPQILAAMPKNVSF